MTNKKSTKKALLTSTLCLLLCMSMLVGTTFAWFTDEVKSGNNIIQAGNLDVELEYAKIVNGEITGWDGVDYAEDIFNPEALWEPGRVEVAYLKVSNLGSLALKYQLGVNVNSEIPGTNVAGETFKLSDHLVFKVVELDAEPTTAYTRDEAVTAAGNVKGLKDYNGGTTALEVGGTDYVALIVYMPETVGNEANYRGTAVPTINLGINLFATQQVAESDSFGPTYDEKAPYTVVTTADELVAAVAEGGQIKLENDVTLSEILVVTKDGTVINGNGKTLTSTAGRAINVSGANGVKIQNLTIEASGERAINVINGATNVTIESVTATAANYTVNVAGSGANAVVAIRNSNLTGLNVVNIAGAGAKIYVTGTTLVCNDQTEVESYAALVLNKDAAGGSIDAVSVTFDIKGDSDKAINQTFDGTITIDGSAADVIEDVAYIDYGYNWYGFATIEAALAKAESGETIYLCRDYIGDLTITQEAGKNVIIDGNGHKFDGTIAINGKSNGTGTETLTIKNINFVNSTDSAASIDAYIEPNNLTRYAHNVTIENCTFTMTGAAKHVAPAVDLYQPYNFTMKNCTVTGAHSVLQNKGGHNGITVENVTAIDCKNGIGLGTMDGAITITGCKLDVIGYGIRVDASVASAGITIADCNIKANIPVALRKATGSCVVTFNGTNVMNATNGDGLWLAAGTQEYGDVDKAGLTAANGAIEVVLNDAGLNAEGVYIAK